MSSQFRFTQRQIALLIHFTIVLVVGKVFGLPLGPPIEPPSPFSIGLFVIDVDFTAAAMFANVAWLFLRGGR